MGTVTIICALFLFIGACTAAPQYPQPQPQTQCRSHQNCVRRSECVDGYINTSGIGVIKPRARPNRATQQYDGAPKCTISDDPGAPAMCCIILGVPETPRFVECPAGSRCIDESSCHIGSTIQDASGNMVPYTSGGSWSSCDNSNLAGVCCATPLPPDIVTSCPITKVCISNTQCDASERALTDGEGVIVPRARTTIATQQNDVNCNVQVTTAAGGYVDQTTEVGVCCDPPKIPLPKLQVCPLKSKCMHVSSCIDRIIDTTGSLVSYAEGGSWSRCDIDGNLKTPGVCCLNPVVASNKAEFGEFPWQAIIFFVSNETFKCGASLIGDEWLLTTAHCVHENLVSDFKVRLGEWQIRKYDEALAHVDVDIANVTIHPQFNNRNHHKNIAVLKLTKPLVTQDHIKPIYLPNQGQTFWGQRCIATGWGKDSVEGQYQHILKKIDLPIVETELCQRLLRKTALGPRYKLDNSLMCAGGEENKDVCEGDGGGPLACRDPTADRYILTGLTSFGIGCGNKDEPGVYADVQALLPFVQAVQSGSYDPNTFGIP